MHRVVRAIQADPTRPRYHFCVPFDLGFPGDPNAMFYADGKYHLMYIYKSAEDSYRWGHVISGDLVHWTLLPDALIPDETDEGIFSGGVYLADDGTAHVAYWALGKNGEHGGIRMATSSAPYIDWTKQEGYVVKSTALGVTAVEGESGNEFVASADPSNIWKKDGRYYMQLGNLCVLDQFRRTDNEKYKGDWAELLVSDDLKNWQYLHRFYKRYEDNRYTDETEDSMCSYFEELPLRNGKLSGKYIQLFLAHNRGAQYYLGEYDKRNDQFCIEQHGRMSFADHCVFAPEALLTPDGRMIAFFWQRDNMDDDLGRERNKGWSGVFAVPRELWLHDTGRLGIAPLRELRKQRVNGQCFHFAGNEESEISLSNTDSCEIVLEIEDCTGVKGLRIYLNGGDTDYVDIHIDFEKSLLVFDLLKSNSKGRIVKDCAPLVLEGKTATLNIFADNCVIDVFANDCQAMTRQVFDVNPGKRRFKAYGVKKAEAFEIIPTNWF